MRATGLSVLKVLNPSLGGTSFDVTRSINPRWVELCGYISEVMDLRLCGVDLACGDITDPEAEYSVIEVNATPGLDHYASSGVEQSRIVDQLYTKVLNTL